MEMLGRSWLGVAAPKVCFKGFAGTTRRAGLENNFWGPPKLLHIYSSIIFNRHPSNQVEKYRNTNFPSSFEQRPGQVEERLQNQKLRQNIPFTDNIYNIYIYMYVYMYHYISH